MEIWMLVGTRVYAFPVLTEGGTEEVAPTAFVTHVKSGESVSSCSKQEAPRLVGFSSPSPLGALSPS